MVFFFSSALAFGAWFPTSLTAAPAGANRIQAGASLATVLLMDTPVAVAPKLVLVTGAGGFLGAHVVRALLQSGHEVRAIVRSGRPRNHIRKLGVELVDGDVLDEPGMNDACKGVDAIIHCASLISYWARQRTQLERINVEGPMVLLRSANAAGVRRIIHISSAGTVGTSTSGEILDESAPWDVEAPLIPYLKTKRMGESLLLAAAWGGMEVVVVNPSLMLGPHLDGSAPSPLISGIMRGRLPWIPPGGVSVTDVTDVAQAVVRSLETGRSGQRYLMAGHNVTWEGLYEAIAESADGRVPKKKLSQRRLSWLTRAARARDLVNLTRPPWTPEVYRSYGSYSWFRSDKAAAELGYDVRSLKRIVRHAVRREDP
ncbi:MAG: dihydroflavonol-4-reductase [Candidatus Paceibacteria bacterium]|jgi:dihydroflavonol-4-reductase